MPSSPESSCGGQLGRLLVFIFTAGGCAVGALACLSCEFFSYESIDATGLPEPFFNQTKGEVGMLKYNDDKGDCVDYESNFFDASDGTHGKNNLWITAQFASVIGPGCGALAFLVNLMEWTCFARNGTYILAFVLLFLAFSIQGLTFMIYGQNEFCFDDNYAGSCKLEIGAIYSIAAAGAFYLASVVWCCMPRNDPIFNSRTVKDDDDYRITVPDYDQQISREMAQDEHHEDEYTPEVVEGGNSNQDPGNTWADSDNRGAIPQQDPQQTYQDEMHQQQVPSALSSWQQQQPEPQPQYQQGAPEHGEFQDHTAEWTAHETTGNAADPQQTGGATDPYDNPFVEDSGAAQNYQRPAYGNLQG